MEAAQYKALTGSMGKMETYLKTIADNSDKAIGSVPQQEDVIKETGKSKVSSDTPDLSKLSGGIKGIVDALSSAGKIKPNTGEAILGFLEGLNNRFLSKVDKDKAESAGSVLQVMSADIGKFASDLSIAAPTLIAMSPIIGAAGSSIGKFIAAMDEHLTEGVGERVGVLADLADGVKKFGLSMLIASPGILLGAVALPLLTLSITPLLWVLSKIKDVKKINEAIGVLPKLGLGLLAFAGGFAASAMILGAVSVDPVEFLGLIVVLGASALAMKLIGQHNKDINRGSLSVLGIGLSTLAFAASLSYASSMIPPLEDSGRLLLTLGATGALFFVAGLGWKNILLGSLAFAGMGISLMILSNPLQELNNAVSGDLDTLWQVPALLGALGGTFALAGAGPIPLLIGAGALAFGAMGIGLISVSKGLEKMLGLPTITQEKADGIEMALRAVVNGFGKSFEDLTLKESLTLPLKIPMVALMGLSMIGLSHGIKVWKSNTGSWTADDTELFKGTISGLSEGFAVAGSTDGMSSLFGFSVGDNSVERGIESTMKIGANLKNLSEGIMAWKRMELTPADVQLIGDNVSRILNVIPNIFGQIGAAERGSQEEASFLGMTFPKAFDKGDVEMGIDSVENLGGTLKSLADGVMAWADGGKAGFNSAAIPQIKDNIQSILSIIPAAFGDIGKADRATEGWFPWSEGDIAKGVALVEDLGPSLSGIADLLASVKGEDITATTTNLVENIPRLLTGYATGLNDFANIYNEDIDAEQVIEDIGDLVDVIKKLSGVDVQTDGLAASMGELITVVGSIPADTGIARFADGFSGFSDIMKATSKSVKHANTGINELIELGEPLQGIVDSLMGVNENLSLYAETVEDLEIKNIESLAEFTSSIADSMGLIAKNVEAVTRMSSAPTRSYESGNGLKVNLSDPVTRTALAADNSRPNIQQNQFNEVPVLPAVPDTNDAAGIKKYNADMMKIMGELTKMMGAVATGIATQNQHMEELNDKIDAGITTRSESII